MSHAHSIGVARKLKDLASRGNLKCGGGGGESLGTRGVVSYKIWSRKSCSAGTTTYFHKDLTMHCQSCERSVTLIWKNDSEIIQKLNSTPAALCFNLEKFNFSWKFKAEKERKNFKREFSSRFTKGFLQRKCVNLFFSFFFSQRLP